MNARIDTIDPQARFPDWASETSEPAYTVAKLACRPDVATVEYLGVADAEFVRLNRERFAQQIDTVARWQGFLNFVGRSAPRAAQVVHVVVEGLRPRLDKVWPLGSLDLDDQVAISWEDHPKFYAHLDLCADGTGTWFCKNRGDGSYEGGHVNSPEQARDAMIAWIGTQERAA